MMPLPTWMRRALFATAAMNILAAIAFLPAASSLKIAMDVAGQATFWRPSPFTDIAPIKSHGPRHRIPPGALQRDRRQRIEVRVTHYSERDHRHPQHGHREQRDSGAQEVQRKLPKREGGVYHPPILAPYWQNGTTPTGDFIPPVSKS